MQHPIGMTADILRKIGSAGYLVTMFRVNGAVEMRALPLLGDGPTHVARCDDGEGEEEAYRAACLLANAVGMELPGQ
ncbi:MAG: hypothetical protein JWP03_1252 [Phycisphaerales bacterium]|jgi:hypothetical protein|nr:hypothetical protein [Phycisphaerales bacterium]HWE92434.1 hypothetical protein [Tepidisphaeraceae bacterium]